MRSCGKMKLFKEIFLIFLGVILMSAGLAMICRAELPNSIMAVGAILIGCGMACFIYLIKDEIRIKR